MHASFEDQVRVRAYHIWISEGCPTGRDGEHWQRAALELATAAVTKPKRGARSAAGTESKPRAGEAVAATVKGRGRRKAA